MAKVLKRNELNMNQPFIEIDLGNESFYIQGITNKAYIEVKIFKQAAIFERFIFLTKAYPGTNLLK